MATSKKTTTKSTANKKATPAKKRTANKPPAIENAPATIDAVVDEVENKPPAIENTPATIDVVVDEVENETPATENVTKKKRYQMTCTFSIEEGEHVEAILKECIEHRVYENQNDFLRNAVNALINNNFTKPSPTIAYPYPDGKDGCKNIEPKMLKTTLLAPFLTHIPTCK